MNYTIRKLDAFLVIGQEIELTNSTVNNIQVSSQFWKVFNTNLKKTYLSQGGILKNMIIDFIGTERVLSLKYGFLLQNDHFQFVKMQVV